MLKVQNRGLFWGGTSQCLWGEVLGFPAISSGLLHIPGKGFTCTGLSGLFTSPLRQPSFTPG